MIISIYNKKGGVGKTTTAIVLGSILASTHGKKVIMIDLDMQGDMSTGLKVSNSDKSNNIFNSIFRQRKLLADKIHDNFIIVNGDPRMSDTGFASNIQNDPVLVTLNPNEILKGLLSKYRDKADIILLDCPPSSDIIARNALIASDYVLIPTKPHNFDVNGVYNVIDQVNILNQGANPNLKVLGIFFSQFDSRTNIHQVMKEQLCEQLGPMVFETHVRSNSKLQEMTATAKDINEFMEELQQDKKAFLGYEDYSLLTTEILSRL